MQAKHIRESLLIIFIVLGLLGCKKYPEDESLGFVRAKKRLIGSWIVTTINDESLTDVSPVASVFTDSCGKEYTYYRRNLPYYKLDINKDKTYDSYSSNTNVRLDYDLSYSSCDAIMDYKVVSSSRDGVWKFRYLKNVLFLYDEEARILKLTDDEMKLYFYKSADTLAFEKII
jgi:hypothetical protein